MADILGKEIKTHTQRKDHVKTGEKTAIFKLRKWVLGETSHAVLVMMPVVLLFTLCPLFIESRVGKVQTKRLEEDAKSCRNCRHVYSLLAGTAAVAADTLFSLFSWLTQQTQP